MSTLENPPKTALLVVDVQNAAVERAHERDTVVANVGSLVERARREGVPVVWVQHSDEHLARGSDGWQIVSDLTPGDAEPLVEKSHGDSFEDTTLETVLSGLGVGRRSSSVLIDWARPLDGWRGGFTRGYDTTLVGDGHATEDQTEWGGAAAGRGHRAHESVLSIPDRAGTYRGDGRLQGRRLRRERPGPLSTVRGRPRHPSVSA